MRTEIHETCLIRARRFLAAARLLDTLLAAACFSLCTQKKCELLLNAIIFLPARPLWAHLLCYVDSSTPHFSCLTPIVSWCMHSLTFSFCSVSCSLGVSSCTLCVRSLFFDPLGDRSGRIKCKQEILHYVLECTDLLLLLKSSSCGAISSIAGFRPYQRVESACTWLWFASADIWALVMIYISADEK